MLIFIQNNQQCKQHLNRQIIISIHFKLQYKNNKVKNNINHPFTNILARSGSKQKVKPIAILDPKHMKFKISTTKKLISYNSRISNQFFSLYIVAETRGLPATVSGNVIFIWGCTGTATTCSFILVRVHILVVIIILEFKLQHIKQIKNVHL